MGGGVIRAAAKVAGFAVPAGGAVVPSAARRTASLRSAATSTQDEVKLVASNLNDSTRKVSSSYVDDWEFAGGEYDDWETAGLMPRVVFGGVPSLQEAQEATSELSVAIEKTFLSSPTSATESVDSTDVDNNFRLRLSNFQSIESKPLVDGEVAVAPTVPSSTMMAFKFLKESPAAQNVVASIACDPNVWNAVLKNEELQEFLKSQRTCVVSSDVGSAEVAADYNMHDLPSPKSDNSEFAKSGLNEGKFMNILEKIKGVVVDMMTGLSDFFTNMFGGKASANSDGIPGSGTEAVMSASIFGLAIMAILVILLKRA